MNQNRRCLELKKVVIVILESDFVILLTRWFDFLIRTRIWKPVSQSLCLQLGGKGSYVIKMLPLSSWDKYRSKLAGEKI